MSGKLYTTVTSEWESSPCSLLPWLPYALWQPLSYAHTTEICPHFRHYQNLIAVLIAVIQVEGHLEKDIRVIRTDFFILLTDHPTRSLHERPLYTHLFLVS